MRRLLVPAVLLAAAAVLALLAGPAVLQWWSVRWSGAPDVARAALTCEQGSRKVVTSVEEKPWGWVVRVASVRVAYFGGDDTSSGAPATYVTRIGDSSDLDAWYSGSYPPFDPATKQPLTAPGAADPWQADMALAVATGRDPIVAQRCSTRNG